MNHLDGTDKCHTAIIITNSIKHYQLNNYSQDIFQATGVLVEDSVGRLAISSLYLPPRHIIKQEDFEDFYSILGRWFIAGVDCTAKHTDWGSRLISHKGRELLKTMESNNLKHLSMVWASGRNTL
jgi:hypothetical protein